jgi:hypothetical protein
LLGWAKRQRADLELWLKEASAFDPENKEFTPEVAAFLVSS